MFKKILILLLLPASVAVVGQENKVITVTGGALTQVDSSNVKKNFYSALQKKTTGNIEQAADLFLNVIETEPHNDAALYELGALYHAQNKETEAEDFALRAVTVNSENKWYWLLLSDIYKKNSDVKKLVPVFDELIRLEPEKENYYFDKANALSLLNKSAEAEAVYKEIETRFGPSAVLDEERKRLSLKKEDPSTAITRLERSIKKEPKDINNYLTLAELYIKTGKPGKAHDLLKKAQKEDPDNSFVHLLLSDVYQSEGKTAEAFSEIKRAFADNHLPIDIKVQIILSYFNRIKDPAVLSGVTELALITTEAHPDDAKAHALYGDVLFQGQKLEEAKQSYKKALALNRNVYLIWAQLLQLETAQNKFKEVIDDGESAIALFPNEPDLYFFLATGYAQSNNHEKAVAYLKNALNLNPKKWIQESDIYSSLGNSLHSLKKYKESDEAFEKSLQLNPDNVYTLNNYAYYLSLRGERLDKAAEMSLRSNELKPDNASFEDTYAWVLFMQKKYTEARIWIEKAIKNNSSSGIQYEHYGDILFHLGEKDFAVEQWEKAKGKGIRSVTLEKKINEKKFFE